MWHAGLDEAQARIKTARRNINHFRHAGDNTLMAESKVELKSLLMKVKEESEKAGLKLNIQKTKTMASGHHFMANRWGKQWKQWQTLFSWTPKSGGWWFCGWWMWTVDGDCSHEIKRRLHLGRKAMTNLDSVLKRLITLPTKVWVVKSYVFSGSHVWMWELDHKEGWALKSWCFWTVVLEKIFESPLDCKDIKPINPKGDQPWIFIGRTDRSWISNTLVSCKRKSWLIGKDPDAGKDWGQEKKGMTENEMVGWHHRLDGHEFEQAPGDSEGQGSLVCCSPWSHRVGHNLWINSNSREKSPWRTKVRGSRRGEESIQTKVPIGVHDRSQEREGDGQEELQTTGQFWESPGQKFPLFPHLFAEKWCDWMPWSSFSECWVLGQLFHSPLSPSSRGCYVPLHFLSLGWCQLLWEQSKRTAQ